MGNLAQQMQIITGPHPVTKHTRHPPATRQTCVLAGDREVMAGIPPFPGPLPMGTHSGWGPSEAVLVTHGFWLVCFPSCLKNAMLAELVCILRKHQISELEENTRH